jgi:hypothetical protein
MAFDIHILNQRQAARAAAVFPGGQVFDLTSKGAKPFVKFSPFFPVGDIPVPHWPGMFSASVEGIWQGLKRFENDNAVDVSRFAITNMRNLKRTSRGKGPSGLPRGKVLGHQRGGEELVLLDYYAARLEIYLPPYRWVLDHKLQEELRLLREAARRSRLVLLDYETNADLRNLKKPLSHCSLVREYLISGSLEGAGVSA